MKICIELSDVEINGFFAKFWLHLDKGISIHIFREINELTSPEIKRVTREEMEWLPMDELDRELRNIFSDEET